MPLRRGSERGEAPASQSVVPDQISRLAGVFPLSNVSSIGGRITTPLLSLYQGTKWAVEGFSESLSYELGELGVQVKLIEPGVVPTDFYGHSMAFAAQEGLTDYNEMLAKYQAAQQNRDNSNVSTPEQLAAAIYGATTVGENRLRYLVGADAEQIMGMREAQGDDGFVAAIRQMMLS